MGVYTGSGRCVGAALLVALLIGAGGCSDSGSGPTPPGFSITVLVKTLGLHPDPDGYSVSVDAEPPQAVGADGRVVFSGLNDKNHQVTLWNNTIASNCQVEDNPRVVDMREWDNFWGEWYTDDQSILIQVYCDWEAALKVTVVTTGANSPATHTLSVSSPWQEAACEPMFCPFIPAVDANGTKVFTGMPAGETSLRLVTPANCAVSDENPRSLYLVHAQVVETDFEVDCT